MGTWLITNQPDCIKHFQDKIGGGGGGALPFVAVYGDVPLDKVWFLASLP